jgi:hypothetical protein
LQRKEVVKIFSPDGVTRSEAEEHRLNLVVVSALGDQAGQELMRYLRSITIEAAAGPHISNDHLRHLEGQRFIVAVLAQRIIKGHEAKAKP